MSLLEFFTTCRYVGVLEGLLKQQREDYQAQIAELKTENRRLRSELASRGDRMVTPAEPVRPKVIFDSRPDLPQPGPLDWQGELNKLVEEEEGKADGVHE